MFVRLSAQTSSSVTPPPCALPHTPMFIPPSLSMQDGEEERKEEEEELHRKFG